MLELAREFGNVAAAYRQSGMDRTSFYEFEWRFQVYGVQADWSVLICRMLPRLQFFG